jgi:hypothetical protein
VLHGGGGGALSFDVVILLILDQNRILPYSEFLGILSLVLIMTAGRLEFYSGRL